MSIDFFREYPKIRYDLYSNGSSIEITDICRAVAINKFNLPDDAQSYIYYNIFDGDRPDIVSHKLYGTEKYYWTFFLLNNRLRAGLNLEWPLSQRDFTRYIDREYGNYSAITILPQKTINGLGILDLSLVPFDEKYLKYLTIVQPISKDDYKIANVVGYDTTRCQLIIKDIRRIANNTRIEISRESFVNDTNDYSNKQYYFSWNDSFIDILPETTDSEKQIKEEEHKYSLALKEEWINIIYEAIRQPGVDYYGWKAHLETFGVESSKNINFRENYIFGKMLIPASNNFRWSYYFNAAHTYYHANGTRIRSAYDTLNDKRVINPPCMTFNEYENNRNDEKSKITVVRPDYIVDFARSYFEILNNE